MILQRATPFKLQLYFCTHYMHHISDGKKLAVGSHDNFVYLFECEDVKGQYNFVGRCAGHSSFITHLDFSADGKVYTVQYTCSPCILYNVYMHFMVYTVQYTFTIYNAYVYIHFTMYIFVHRTMYIHATYIQCIYVA